MSDDMAESSRQTWVVSLDVVGPDDVRYEWTYETGGVPASATSAIDHALAVCDDKVVGLNYVRKETDA